MDSVLSHSHSETTRDIRKILSAAGYRFGTQLSIKKKNKKRNSVVRSGDCEKAMVRSIRGIVFSERRRRRKKRGGYIGSNRDLNSEDRETNLNDPDESIDTLWSDLWYVTVYYIDIKEQAQGVEVKIPKNSIKR